MTNNIKIAIKCLTFSLSLCSANVFATTIEPLDKDYTLQILGSGGPISDDLRASSGAVIWWKGQSKFMIDAGGATFLRFGQSGAKLEDLDFLGITHFHTDHVADVPAILKGGYFFNRTNPLYIAGPTGGSGFPSLTGYINALFNPQYGAYAYLNGLTTGDGIFPIIPIDVPYKKKNATVVYNKDDIVISAFGIPHGNVPCLAYRFDTKKGSIVISADQNGTNSDFINFAKGADILVMPGAIHEDADEEVSAFMHAKPSTVGKIAAQINPKLLVIDHWMGMSLKKQKEVLEIIKKYYHGEVFAARDLSSYPITAIKK
ncbi:MBL fold metallo-hydrolase [Photobacterium kishitanii]|nr:MBL fold metallo-hydrolase [Photobacterium kishitanii]PSW49490.1 MBL fold metallo-hydrolase [Photobacterium kishitanii]